MQSFWGNTKPPAGVMVDRSHPLAQGLVGCWALSEGAGSGFDSAGVLNRQRLELQGATWKAGPGGRVLDCTSTNYAMTNTGTTLPDAPYLGALTIVCRALIRTGGAYREFVNKAASGGSATTPFDFRTTNAATPLLAFVRANTGYREFNGPAVTLNRLRSYAVTTTDSLLTTSPTFYIDGAPTSGGASVDGSGTGAVTGVGHEIRLGQRNGGGVQMDGYIEHLMIWRRALTAPEMSLLAAQPYQMFAPPVWRRYFVVAGGPATAGAVIIGGAARFAVQAQREAIGTAALVASSRLASAGTRAALSTAQLVATARGALAGVKAAAAAAELRAGAIGATQTIKAATSQGGIRGSGRLAASSIRAAASPVSMRATAYAATAVALPGIDGPRGSWLTSTRKRGTWEDY